MWGVCFFLIHWVSLCLLVEAFNLSSFKIIIVYMFWLPFCCFVSLSSSLPLLFTSLMIWWLIFVLWLDSFFFFVYVSLTGFQCVLTLRFCYRGQYTNKIVLNFCSFNFKCIPNIFHLCCPQNCWFWYPICVQMIFYLCCVFTFTWFLIHNSLFSGSSFFFSI